MIHTAEHLDFPTDGRGFDTILVANRGEIALRIFRTARAMGYRTVAVYSEADAELPHARAADQALCIGPAPASESYLDIERLIDAARRSGAQAVHPGYGFLSESDVFAEACRHAGLIFIGPSPEAIRNMGNKATAKRLMADSGVPCIPGYDGAGQRDEVLMQEASRIGFPVMIKAMAGGGGKGMRLVGSAAEMVEGLRAARSEAVKAFACGDLMLEKAILAPRHVEVQVFGDTHGNVVHLGDRDCSIQRRHQKVIEEAPAPGLSDALRARMADAAVKAARAVNYVGAGTVEFLVAGDQAFYFLEMNTRLQVEHPVTEMVTGLDLVEWQLRVAAGEPLPLPQEKIKVLGHSIEVRVYAEDPAADFLPQSGELVMWQPPDGPGVRVDHGLCAGASVSTRYDPMIAKVIGSGPDRDVARRVLARAIEEFVIAGVRSNRAFLRQCLVHPAFAQARLSTAFLDEYFGERASSAPDPAIVAVAAALFQQAGASRARGGLHGWRSRPWESERLLLESGDWTGKTSIKAMPGGAVAVEFGGRTTEVLVLDAKPKARVRVDGVDRTVHYTWADATLHLVDGDAYFALREVRVPAQARGAHGAASVRAPMPGSIAEVRCEMGAVVKAGDVLLILEAMKMEHQIVSPVSGRVVEFQLVVGQQVAMRQTLVEIVAEVDLATA